MQEKAFMDNSRRQNQTCEKKRLIQFIKKSSHSRQQSHGNKKKKNQAGFSSGQWTFREVKLYFRYLSTHKNQFTDPHLRKRNKVFIKLADYIGSRTPDQCRSHHQKATKRYPQFQDLLKHYQLRIDRMQRMYQSAKDQQGDMEEDLLEEKVQREDNNFAEQHEQEKQEVLRVKEQNSIGQIDMRELPMQQQPKGQSKIQKATGEVITKNFYTLYMDSADNLQRIEIDFDKVERYNQD